MHVISLLKVRDQNTTMPFTSVPLFLRSSVWLTLLFLSMVGTANSQSAPEAIVGERLVAAEWPVSVRSASHAEDEESLLIVCHSGLVMWFDESTGEVREEPFLDLSSTGLDLVDYGIMSEQGLNDLILYPDFEDNGLFYVIYNGYRPD